MSKDSLLLAATNHQQLLDSAVWRRFDYKLEIELPDKEAISKLIYLFTGHMGTLSEKDVTELSTLFYGLSGAEIEELITKSIRNAVIHNHFFDKKISMRNILFFKIYYLKIVTTLENYFKSKQNI